MTNSPLPGRAVSHDRRPLWWPLKQILAMILKPLSSFPGERLAGAARPLISLAAGMALPASPLRLWPLSWYRGTVRR